MSVKSFEICLKQKGNCFTNVTTSFPLMAADGMMLCAMKLQYVQAIVLQVAKYGKP